MTVARDHHGERLRALTFLRFIAAVMVVCTHTAGWFGFSADADRQTLQFALSTSVTFFFLLSGFLLTWNYGARARPGWQGHYFRARVARIFPLYLCVLAAMALFDPEFSHRWHDAVQIGFFPLHALLMQSWWPVSAASIASFIGPAWSLSTEWAFYLAFPLLLVALQSRPAWLAVAAVAAALAMVAFAHQMAPTFGSSAAYFEAIQPFARLPEFVLGMWMGERLRRGKGAPIGSLGVSAELAAIAVILGWLYVHESLARPAIAVSPYLYDWLRHTGAAPAWAFAIAIMARSSGPLARTFRRPSFVMLGEMSFAVFLIHLPLLRMPIWMQLQYVMHWPPWLVGVAYATALLSMSWLATRYIRVIPRKRIPAGAPEAASLAEPAPAVAGATGPRAAAPVAPVPHVVETQRTRVAARIAVHDADVVFARTRPRADREDGSITALSAVSLAIGAGERVGVIGHNGAGKSTLLRMLAGIYPPTRGSLRVDGTVRTLFDLNLGFDAEGSGRRNIDFQGLLLGLSPSRIRALTPQIIEFADLGEAIDRPVRSYSAGMVMRLGFAIAAHSGGDIWLLDEIVGAGDLAFAARAHRRIVDLMAEARIVVVASHGLEFIRENCTRAIVMSHGRVACDDLPDRAIAFYENAVLGSIAAAA